MYCPNCGTKISFDQKFCRACGLGLEKIAQSLAEQLPTQLDENLLAKKNRLERLGVTALSIFGVGLFGLLVYLVGYKLMISQGKLLAGLGVIGFIVLIASGLLSVVLFAKANEVQEESSKRRLQRPEEKSLPADTAKLLPEGHLEPIPSVTERTTELLRTEKK
jgi:zinc-ribbon domain